MTARQYGFFGGLALFLILLLLPAPEGMPIEAWRVAALVALMASWWMTEALPLTATALLPFVALPFMTSMTTNQVAATYYSPILFLILGGAFLALAIERTGLHRRLALAIIGRAGKTAWGLLFAFMAATAILSMIVSNTSTTLIMVPIAIAVLAAGGVAEGETKGFAGALLMGIAFAASIGGIGTLVGSPTNAIAAGLINRTTGTEIDFLTWAKFGLPVVAMGIPLCLFILIRTQRVTRMAFDIAAAKTAIGDPGAWSGAEKRLVPVIMLVVAGWVVLPFIKA
ncbi:MAG: SLC13 family permease, partial [Parasphingopyxis sp.]